MSEKKIAIFGGTFDPPHLGHLILAEQIKNNFGLAEIIFMPAGSPPHKKDKKISSAQVRYEMLKLAVRDNPSFLLSDWEIKAKGYSYTAKTLSQFVPQIKAEKVFFIIGADSLANIFEWEKADFLLSEGEFIVFNRPGYNFKEILAKKRYQAYQQNIFTYHGLNIEISSSYIRNEFKKGNSIRYLTLSQIEKYIKENNLYR